LDRSYSRRARRAKSRGAALSQKHAKQTKDVPTHLFNSSAFSVSDFQFFSFYLSGPFVSFVTFCLKNLNIKEFEQKHAKQTKDVPATPFHFFSFQRFRFSVFQLFSFYLSGPFVSLITSPIGRSIK
jgi:hypothetical protein